jgi:hypothetical protein
MADLSGVLSKMVSLSSISFSRALICASWMPESRVTRVRCYDRQFSAIFDKFWRTIILGLFFKITYKSMCCKFFGYFYPWYEFFVYFNNSMYWTNIWAISSQVHLVTQAGTYLKHPASQRRFRCWRHSTNGQENFHTCVHRYVGTSESSHTCLLYTHLNLHACVCCTYIRIFKHVLYIHQNLHTCVIQTYTIHVYLHMYIHQNV